MTSGKCPFLSGEFVWRAECRASSCPNVPPWVCNVLYPNRRISLQQFTPSDLIMDWEKGRTCCFLMGKCPNSMCFIKKIAGITSVAKKRQPDLTVVCWGCPGCAPQCDRGIAPTRTNGKWFCYIHPPQVPQLNPGEIQSWLWQSCSLLVQDAKRSQPKGRSWQWETAWQSSVCGSAYLQEGSEAAHHCALTASVSRFLAYKGDEWLQFILLVTKTTWPLCEIMKIWWVCC